MRSPAKKNEYPLSMRLPEQDIAIIMENTLLRMSPQGFDRFMTLIAAPAKAVPAMVKLLKRKSPWETGGKRD